MSCWCKQQGLQGGCATKFDYSVLKAEDFKDGNIIVLVRDYKIDEGDYHELAKALMVYAEEVHGEPQRLTFVLLPDKNDISVLNDDERKEMLTILTQEET